jgi:hypothetical protein
MGSAGAAIDIRLVLCVSSKDCLEPLLELYWLSRFWSELFIVKEVSARVAEGQRGEDDGRGGSGEGRGEGVCPPKQRKALNFLNICCAYSHIASNKSVKHDEVEQNLNKRLL